MAGNPTSSSSQPKPLPMQQSLTMIEPSSSQQLEPLQSSSPSLDYHRQQWVQQRQPPQMVQLQQKMVQPLQHQQHGSNKVNGGIGSNNLIGVVDFQGMERNLSISRANQMQQSCSTSSNINSQQLGMRRQQPQQPSSSIYGEMDFGGMNVTQQPPPNNNHHQQIGHQTLQQRLQLWQEIQLHQQEIELEIQLKQQIWQQSQIQQQIGHQGQLQQQQMGQTGHLPVLSAQAAELILQGQFLRQQLSRQRARSAGQAQNGQLGMMQNAISQQQLKQMPSTSSVNTSLRLQQKQLASTQLGQNSVSLNQQKLSLIVPQQTQISQQQQPLQHQLVHQRQSPRITEIEGQKHQLASVQLHQNSVSLNQQELSQIVPQQTQMSQQQQPPQHQLVHQQQQKLSQIVPQQTQMCHPQVLHQTQQQQPPHQQLFKSVSQPDATASGATTPDGGSSQGTTSNQLLGKRKIQDLVSQVTSTLACTVAKHHKSSTLEANDVLLHLEKDWNLTIPGYSSEEKKEFPHHPPSDDNKRLLEVSETNSAAKAMLGQESSYQVDPNHMIRSSQSSEQLVSQSALPLKLQQNTRF